MRALILEAGKARETRDYADVAAAHRDKKTFWVELVHRTAEADEFLEQTLGIHPLTIEDIWQDVSLPKVEDFGAYIQVIIHGLRHDRPGDASRRAKGDSGPDRPVKDVPLVLTELDLLIGSHFLVTHAHEQMACAVEPLQEEVLRNAHLLERGPAWLAHAVMDRVVDEYVPLIERFDDQIEAVEERILSPKRMTAQNMKAERTIIPRILRIKRSLQVLRRTAVFQREILLRLSRGDFDEIPRELAPFYRDVYDHFSRVTELVDGNRELLTSLLEAHLSMQSNRMNEIMKRLTVISTVMLPLTVIAGVYGMNFEDMPELHWAWGYPLALSLMAAVAIAILAWFRIRKWL